MTNLERRRAPAKLAGVAKSAAIVAFVALAFATRAIAGDTVQRLLQACQADQGTTEELYCAGKVSGIADIMLLNGGFFRAGRVGAGIAIVSACPGSPVTYGAFVQAFVSWASLHPDQLGVQDFVGVARAIRDTWPCR